MIKVFEDINALSRAAAEIFAREALKAVQSNGRFSVLLAGGETPRRTYEILAGEPFRSTLPWGQVHIFWGDERCVPVDDPRSNTLKARRAFLDLLPVPESHIHPVKTGLPPEEAAVEYESVLRVFFSGAQPVFDLVLLGLGEDGHTASLFPGTARFPDHRWVVVTRREGEEISRISLTPQVINQAARAVFLVSGANKADVLKEVLQGAFDPCRLPAQQIRLPENRLEWFVDRDAAGLIAGAGAAESF